VSALALAELPEQGALFGGAGPPAAPAEAPAAAPDRVAAPPAAAGSPLDGPTLDDVISHAWEALGAQVAAACPVCGGEVEPHGHAAGGRCGSCGTTLD
jgi:hypothetical protein